MARIYLETYGCTLNQADSDIIKALLAGKNHTFIESEKGSDVVIINTCTVKDATENKIMHRIKDLRSKGHPLVVAGCMSANVKKIRKVIPEAPIVSPSSLAHIGDAVEEAISGNRGGGKAGGPGFGSYFNSNDGKDALPKMLTAPIARIPINDGCTSNCFFCQTKLARPFLRSYSPKSIVKWIQEAVRGGAIEIQLTSQDAGAYGLDIKTDLVSLLDLIIHDDSSSSLDKETKSEPNKAHPKYCIRLGMINPNHAKRMLPGIIRALKNDKFYRFIHIPVQTGSQRICKAMNRDHTVKDFVDIVASLRREIPDVLITTDIIVGYPGESEKDFKDTLRMLEKVRPEITNVSKFSPRPGTKAKEMEQLPNTVVKSRCVECVALIRKISEEAKMAFEGRIVRTLVTEKDLVGKGGRKDGDFKGRDSCYRQVVVKRFKGVLGDSLDVRITGSNRGSLFGEPV